MEKGLKAIIPVAGRGTRFLPLSQVVPKELWPLLLKPMAQYVVEEAQKSGVKDLVFVSRPEKKIVLDYFASQKVAFEKAVQKNPLGDGHAVLQAKKYAKKPVAVLFGDDIVVSKTPCLLQIIRVFKKYQRPVMALTRVSKSSLSSYGVVGVEKISQKVYKIKSIVEKPSPKQAPSNLAIVGKYILTPEVFQYFAKAQKNKKGEITLAENFATMIKDGKEILGCQFEGKWLECGTKEKWLKSFLYLASRGDGIGRRASFRS